MRCNSISSSLSKQTPHVPEGLCSVSSWKESLPLLRQKRKPSESGRLCWKSPNTPFTETAWIVVLSAGDTSCSFALGLKHYLDHILLSILPNDLFTWSTPLRNRLPLHSRAEGRTLMKPRVCRIRWLGNWSERLPSLSVQVARLFWRFSFSLFKQMKLLQ